jgi:hypothetical protein
MRLSMQSNTDLQRKEHARALSTYISIAHNIPTSLLPLAIPLHTEEFQWPHDNNNTAQQIHVHERSSMQTQQPQYTITSLTQMHNHYTHTHTQTTTTHTHTHTHVLPLR